MRILDLDFAAFRIPLRRPLRIAGKVVDVRAGVLIRLHATDGAIGLGEAAPHPLLGADGVHEVLRAAADLQSMLRAAGPFSLEAFWERVDGVHSRVARAGFEIAGYDLAAQHAGVRLAAMFGGAVRECIPVNAVVDQLEPASAAAAARALVTQGFRCLKLKVSADVTADAERVRRVRAAVGADIRLRIDANGAWTREQAVRFLPQLARHELEYVEQPVMDVEELAHVRHVTGVRIAADECVTGPEIVQQLAAAGAADVVVVKPALLGLRCAAAVIQTAQACGLEAVITSALDTSIGITAAAHLAATLPQPIPCGLATAALLTADLVAEPLVLQQGRLHLPSGAGLGVRLDDVRWRQLTVDSGT